MADQLSPNDLIAILHTLRAVKRPSARVKKSIAKCEELLCVFVEALRYSRPTEPTSAATQGNGSDQQPHA